MASFTLDVGEDHIVLATRSNIYGLDVYLPYNVIQEEVSAQFNRQTKVRLFLCDFFHKIYNAVAQFT